MVARVVLKEVLAIPVEAEGDLDPGSLVSGEDGKVRSDDDVDASTMLEACDESVLQFLPCVST